MIKNLIKVGAGNLVNGVGGLVFIISAAKILTLDEFGRFTLAAAIFTFVAKLTEMGTSSSYVALSIKQSKDFRAAFIALKSLMLAICTAVGVFVINHFGLSDVSLFFVLGLAGYALNDYFFAEFLKKEKFVWTALTNSFPALVKLAAGVLFVSLEPSSTWVYGVYMMCYLPTILLYPLLDKTPLRRLDHTDSKKIFAQGIFGGISQTLNLAYPAFNTTLIKLQSGFSDVGLFGLSDKLSSIFSLASLSIFTVLLPHKSKEFKSSGKYNFSSIVLMSTFVALSVLMMILLIKPTVLTLFGTRFDKAVALLYILTVAAGINAVTSFLDHYFYIVEKTKVLLALNSLKALCYFGVSSVFIHYQGIFGLAYSSLLLATVGFIVTIGTMLFLESRNK